jgi:Cyclic nucleotide-binding domain
MADAFPLLRRSHLFVAVNDADLKELAGHFALLSVEPEAYVFNQGELADGFYIIQSGQVVVETYNYANGKMRTIAVLIDGDYFGEIALVTHGHRSASVRATKPLKVFKITNEEFNQFVLGNPKIKPNLEVAIRARTFARQANFKWLAPNEIVYLVTLRHQIFLFEMLWKPVLLGLASLLPASLIYYYSFPLQFQLISVLVLLAGVGWFWWNWIDFHNDWYVVTNQRVVDIDKVVLFYDSRAEAPLSTVQSTAIKTNELGRQFNYGDVVINTYSGPIVFNNVPYPQATSDMVLEQVNRIRVQIKQGERNQLKNNLRQAIGLDTAGPKGTGAGTKKPSGAIGAVLGAVKDFSLNVREQQGDTIIYHKHPVVLLGEVAGDLAGILLTIFALSIRVGGVLDFINLWVYLAVCVVILVILVYRVAYEYFDWKNDVYMVSPTQIMDVERKPFGNEQRKAANLEAITNIAFVRPGLLYQIFNYGTVTVNAGPGGEMKFFDVFDPLSVQQDIYRRKEGLAKVKSDAAAKARVEELSQYMAAFYEVMEDERKKRETGK